MEGLVLTYTWFNEKRYGGVCLSMLERRARAFSHRFQSNKSRFTPTFAPTKHQSSRQRCDLLRCNCWWEWQLGLIVAIKDDKFGITVKYSVSIMHLHKGIALTSIPATTVLWCDSCIDVIAATYDFKTTEMRNVNTHYNNPTLTTNGNENITWFLLQLMEQIPIPLVQHSEMLPFQKPMNHQSMHLLPISRKKCRFYRTRWLCQEMARFLHLARLNLADLPLSMETKYITSFKSRFPSYEFDDDATATEGWAIRWWTWSGYPFHLWHTTRPKVITNRFY